MVVEIEPQDYRESQTEISNTRSHSLLTTQHCRLLRHPRCPWDPICSTNASLHALDGSIDSTGWIAKISKSMPTIDALQMEFTGLACR